MVMPPAFIVNRYKIDGLTRDFQTISSKSYSVEGYVTKGNILSDINHDLLKYVVDAWKKNEPEVWQNYVNWDVRFAIASQSARENDRKLKILKWVDYEKELHRLLGTNWSTKAYQTSHDWVTNARKHLAYDDWTKRYVKEHETSHPTRGYSWGQILQYGYMERLYDFTREWVEWWDDNFEKKGDWCMSQTALNIGLRGRSPEVHLTGYQQFELDRARSITFMPGPSSVNAFYNHEASVKFMRKVFDEYESILGCRIISPKTEGGKAYTILRDYYMDGKALINYDVSGMELITPSLIQGRTHSFDAGVGAAISYLGPAPELASGVSPTSDWDIFAHLELIKLLMIKAPLLICILGDDNTSVGGLYKNSILYEKQIKDQAIHRTLGLTTTKYMHPVGLNITIDNAKKSIRLIEGHWVKQHLNLDERKMVAELFTGFVNEKPLHELIGKISSQPFVYSPKDLLRSGLGIPIGI